MMMYNREELKALSYLHGGKILLDKYLMIEEAGLTRGTRNYSRT